MKFIGLRLCEHDSNISYSDGITVKYYKSERDYQIKHHGFDDLNQWKKIIDIWNINPSEIDAIGIVLDCFRYRYLKCDETKIYETIDVQLFKLMGFECPVFRIDHHYAHFLSSWTLGINPTIGFVFDGFGDDYITHTIFKDDKKLVSYHREDLPSLGSSLSEASIPLGIGGSPYDIPGKVMALKGYGNVSLEDLQREKIRLARFNINFLDMLWNTPCLFNMEKQEQYNHIQICHEISEDIFVGHFKKYANNDDIISYSGGVAQNTIVNSKIKNSLPNLHIPPHCTDEGLSLGVIEFLRKYFQQEKFDTTGYPFWQSDQSPDSVASEKAIEKAAELLAQGKIVGWYQGKGEVGSRALGNRSILMSPLIKNGKEILNERVKHREWFRPFGASVLEEETKNYFDWEGPSPYMLYVMDVLDKQSFPAITHVDGTCRIQTVSSELSTYYRLIEKFKELTGVPILLNTSLNNNGRPICGRMDDAKELLISSDMDALVLGNAILEKG